MPSSASLLSVGVWTSPPKVSATPKPTSSIKMTRIFGASSARCDTDVLFARVLSARVSLAMLKFSGAGKGRTEPSSGVAAETTPAQNTHRSAICEHLFLIILSPLDTLSKARPTRVDLCCGSKNIAQAKA